MFDFIIGPYAQVPVLFQKVERKNSTCNCHKSNQTFQTNFCPNCGARAIVQSTIEPVFKLISGSIHEFLQTTEDIHFEEDVNAIKDAFITANNYEYLTGDKLLNPKEPLYDRHAPSKNCNYSFHSKQHLVQLLDLTDLNPQLAIESFAKDYEEELMILRTYYPEVKLLYGVLAFYP